MMKLTGETPDLISESLESELCGNTTFIASTSAVDQVVAGADALVIPECID